MKLLDIITSPWAIVPEKLTEIRAIYAAHIRGEKIDFKAIEGKVMERLGISVRDTYDIVSGVAIIPIKDIITKDPTFFSFLFGDASTKAIAGQFRDALNNQDVEAIMLDIDSPGGTVDGTQELAELIFASRGIKPIISFTDGQMTSAAYWIGAAAGPVFISGDTQVLGSIGTITSHTDLSKLQENVGVKTTDIYAGKYKGILSDNKPLSEEGKNYLQDMTDYFYSVFVNDVAKYRGVSVEEALKMADGKLFIGRQAIDAGLVDGVSTYDELIDKMAAGDVAVTGKPNIRKEKAIMDLKEMKEKYPDLYAEAVAIGKDEGIKEGKAIGLQAVTTEAATAASAAETQRIKDIEALSIPGHEAMIAEMKFDGKTTKAEAAVRILQAEQGVARAAAEALKADGVRPVAHVATDGAGGEDSTANMPDGPEKWKAEYAADAKLQQEFKSVENYTAYRQGVSEGRVKILGRKVK